METTGSTGVYGGPAETPETATLLAKKEPEVDGGGLSCNTPMGGRVVVRHPDEICSPAIHTVHVANPMKIIAY